MDGRALFPGWAKDLIDSRSVKEACYTGLLTSQRPGTPIVLQWLSWRGPNKEALTQIIPTCHPRQFLDWRLDTVRVDPEKNAWEAVSELIEFAPKVDERTNTASEALFGVCVRLETWLSQACPRRALSRL